MLFWVPPGQLPTRVLNTIKPLDRWTRFTASSIAHFHLHVCSGAASCFLRKSHLFQEREKGQAHASPKEIQREKENIR